MHFLSLSLFLSSSSLNVRFCWRLCINMNRDSAYTDSELSRRACSCNCTPTRPTTVGYRLDLDNDSPSGHRALTVSPSPGFSFRFLCISTLMHVQTILFYRSLLYVLYPHLRISMYPRISSHWHGVNFQSSVYVHRRIRHFEYILIWSKGKIKSKNLTLVRSNLEQIYIWVNFSNLWPRTIAILYKLPMQSFSLFNYKYRHIQFVFFKSICTKFCISRLVDNINKTKMILCRSRKDDARIVQMLVHTNESNW